jgi:hypothetical protein
VAPLTLFVRSGCSIECSFDELLTATAVLGLGAGTCFRLLCESQCRVSSPRGRLASGLVNTTGRVGGALSLAVIADLGPKRPTLPGRAGDGFLP